MDCKLIIGIVILLIVGISVYLLFRELKKDYKDELKQIKDEHGS